MFNELSDLPLPIFKFLDYLEKIKATHHELLKPMPRSFHFLPWLFLHRGLEKIHTDIKEEDNLLSNIDLPSLFS